MYAQYRGVVAPVNIPGEMTPRIGMVCFAFGVAQGRPGEPVPGPVLLRLLADLGISGAAARSLLLRMRREEWLSSERVGRQANYRLAPVIDVAQARLDRQLRGERPAWSGSFNGLLYTVPERHRSFRDRLRRSAQLLGYVTLRPGLLVATTDRYEELTALLPSQPDGSQVLRARVTLSPGDSRRIAGQLWDLDALAARYRAVAAHADSGTSEARRQPPIDAAAFRAFAAATLPIYEAGAEDPDLPADLLPADWPGPQLGAALSRAFQVFGPLLGDYLKAVVGGGSAEHR
jgi:phenylacetic acid degradation operon negative regulatory protein